MGLPALKKGEIEIAKLVYFIIAAVVLIVVIAFFLGGTTGITKTVKNLFFGVTAGTDLTLAVENCKHYCQQAKGLSAAQQSSSAYCKHYEHIDSDQDGEADIGKEDSVKGKVFTQWYCPPQGSYSSQPSFEGGVKYLNIPCDAPIQC